MKRSFCLVLVIAMAIIFSACASDSAHTASSVVDSQIAILIPGADHGWTGAVLRCAHEKAEEIDATGNHATVYASSSPEDQSHQISSLINSDSPPDAIVILPYNNDVTDAVAELSKTDVPFTMFDRIILTDDVQADVVSNVTGDNFGIGALTAHRFIEQGLEPGEDIYVIIGDTSSVPETRNEGFLQTLTEAGWSEEDIANIEFSEATHWSRDEANVMFSEWLNSTDEFPRFIFTHDDEIAMGILEVLTEGDAPDDKVRAFTDTVISIASSSGLNEMYEVLRGEHSSEDINAIADTFDLFSVTYDPSMIKIAVDDIMNHLGGGTPEKNHVIESQIVDSSNASGFTGF